MSSSSHDNLTRSALRDSKSLLSQSSSQSRAPRPWSATLGGVNSFHDAVFLDVRGGGPLFRLHERLFDLAALPTLPSYSYLPHCTIAHYDGTTPHEEALALLAPWRNEIIGHFIIAEVEIVTLDPDEAYPELTTYAVIPFGG